MLHVLLVLQDEHPVNTEEHYLQVLLSLSKYFVDRQEHLPLDGLAMKPLSLLQIVQ